MKAHIPLLICSLLCLLIYLLVAGFVALQTDPTPEEKADAIVVLGAKAYLDGHYNPCLVSRVHTAVQLFQQWQAPVIIVSGGIDTEDQKNEAETMAALLQKASITPSHILLESTSTSTYENLFNVRKIMNNKTFHTIIVVTDPFHIARAMLVAKTLGLDATFAAASDSPCWTNWTSASGYFLREPLVILWYLVTGKIALWAWWV